MPCFGFIFLLYVASILLRDHLAFLLEKGCMVFDLFFYSTSWIVMEIKFGILMKFKEKSSLGWTILAFLIVEWTMIICSLIISLDVIHNHTFNKLWMHVPRIWFCLGWTLFAFLIMEWAMLICSLIISLDAIHNHTFNKLWMNVRWIWW